MGVSADFVLNYAHKSRFNLLRSVVFELFVLLMGGGWWAGLYCGPTYSMNHHYIMFPRFVTNLILRLLFLPKERNHDLLVVYSSAGCRLWRVMAVILISDIRIGSDWTISVPGWRRPSVHW